MSVPAGYKASEVGVIPADWEAVPLGSLGAFSKGQGIRKDQASSGDIPCVRYGEIYTDHNDVVRKYRSRISRDVAATSKLLRKGDLLFAGSGETKEEIGKCVAFVDDVEAYAGGDIVILSPRAADSIFLGYLMNADPIMRQKAARAQGDMVVHISARALAEVTIPLPPTTDEQSAIADALSDVDRGIAAVEAVIAKKRALKTATMQALLSGTRRLPGFSGAWEVKALGQCLNRKPSYGINAPAAAFDDRLPRYLRITDITEDGRFSNLSPVSVDHVATDSYFLGVGDLVFARTGASTGKCYRYRETDGPLVYAGFLILVAPNPELLDSTYLAGHVRTQQFSNYVAEVSQRSGQPGINGNQLAAFKLPIPPTIAEQSAIAEVLDDMENDIEVFESKLQKLRQLKTGMMQQLLTGKIRLI